MSIPWSLEHSSGPAFEPVTLAEVKAHGVIETDEDDGLLTGMIIAAREYLEAVLSRALIAQTWVLRLDRFPSGSFHLPRPPLASITSLEYVNLAGVQQTLDPTAYQVDTKAHVGRVAPAYNTVWPPAKSVPNAVEVTYVSGWASRGAVPEPIREKLRALAVDLYRTRGGSLALSIDKSFVTEWGSQWEPEFC